MSGRVPWFDAPRKGTAENPLIVSDLPFTVPKAGRYWLRYGASLTLLPESPKGSVLALDISRADSQPQPTEQREEPG